MAVEILKEAREAFREEARAYQARYKGQGVCIRARNRLLEAAKITVALVVLTNAGM